jgi:hypothetical protein
VHTVAVIPNPRIHSSLYISPVFIFLYVALCLFLLALLIGLCVRFCSVESEKENFDRFEDEEILIKVKSPKD